MGNWGYFTPISGVIALLVAGDKAYLVDDYVFWRNDQQMNNKFQVPKMDVLAYISCI